jgi:hypothetical protein
MTESKYLVKYSQMEPIIMLKEPLSKAVWQPSQTRNHTPIHTRKPLLRTKTDIPVTSYTEDFKSFF